MTVLVQVVLTVTKEKEQTKEKEYVTKLPTCEVNLSGHRMAEVLSGKVEKFLCVCVWWVRKRYDSYLLYVLPLRKVVLISPWNTILPSLEFH